MSALKTLIATVLIQMFILFIVATSTPEATIKTTDHFSCDINGSVEQGPVDVQFLIARGDKRVVVIKTEADSWDRAQAICTSWNDIGYELEK